MISAYDPAVTDPYLGVSGPISFPFFGLHPLNIRDALATAPQRHVTVPKAPITPHAPPTELALSGTWHDVNSNDLAVFVCAEPDVDYDVAHQYGFRGTGTGRLSFLQSDPLHIDVEINSDATDIHFNPAATHDLDVGMRAGAAGAEDDGRNAGCREQGSVRPERDANHLGPPVEDHCRVLDQGNDDRLVGRGRERLAREQRLDLRLLARDGG